VLEDEGLEVVGKTSKRLKRIRVDGQEGLGTVTHRGLTAIAEGCHELQFLVMYLSDVTNASLAAVGRCLTNLTDFRIVLLQTSLLVRDLPLDMGVQSLLQGCPKLTRFSVYLRSKCLTDTGVSFIGELGRNLKWVLLGCCGDSGIGISNLAHGCQKIERLELRNCPVGEVETAVAVLSMQSLKYFWVQGFGATEAVGQCLAAKKPYMHVELMPSTKQLLAYYSLTSPRTDGPPTVQVLNQEMILCDQRWLVIESEVPHCLFGGCSPELNCSGVHDGVLFHTASRARSLCKSTFEAWEQGMISFLHL